MGIRAKAITWIGLAIASWALLYFLAKGITELVRTL